MVLVSIIQHQTSFITIIIRVKTLFLKIYIKFISIGVNSGSYSFSYVFVKSTSIFYLIGINYLSFSLKFIIKKISNIITFFRDICSLTLTISLNPFAFIEAIFIVDIFAKSVTFTLVKFTFIGLIIIIIVSSFGKVIKHIFSLKNFFSFQSIQDCRTMFATIIPLALILNNTLNTT